MIKLLETGTGVFFCSLLIVGTYDVINNIIVQYTYGTKISFFLSTDGKVPFIIV